MIENYISVDVETAGPNPSQFPMLSIGACLVEDTSKTFYVELKPDRDGFEAESLSISGLSLIDLQEKGTHPKKAMQTFADWVKDSLRPGERPVFVAFNAVFDWMFVNDYFHRYLGENPFGHAALDIKAYYMGLSRSRWEETKQKLILKELGMEKGLSHHALKDAQDQAELFCQLLEYYALEVEND